MSNFKNKTFLQSIKKSLVGMKTAFKIEKNFKNYLFQYIFFFLINLLALRLTVNQMLLYLAIGAGVLSSEFINTAIEQICDFIKEDYDTKIRDIKDIAASAVCIWGIIFYGFEITMIVTAVMKYMR